MPITTPQDLREHIEFAIKVELSTIPPYLYAMYSIEDQKSDAALLIRSIAAEEMLHAALATNLLLAVGGNPDFRSSDFMPRYPGLLPHHTPDLPLHLAPASLELIENTFMVIEQPEARGALPEADEFETLGQFYQALEESIHLIAAQHDVFADPQRDRQMGDHTFYAPVAFDADDSGGLSFIDDVESACAAIEVIVHQGEGMSDAKWADPSHQELTHYHKLSRIARGKTPLGRVRETLVNPTTAQLPPVARSASDLFNATYRYLYVTMDDLFGPTADKGALVGRLYALMSGALSMLALYLTSIPAGDGKVAGPTFEIYEFGDADPLASLRELAATAIVEHPELTPVAELIESF